MPARRVLLAAMTAAAVLAPLGHAAPADPVRHSRCFGAAARDPARQPCRDPRLRLAVVPTPDRAALTPIADCEVVERRDDLVVCASGAAPEDARGTVALIGDSHAMHWMPAVDVVARRRGLRAYLLGFPGCTFSRAIRAYDEAMVARCERWKDQVLAWLERHPEVGLVFTSNFFTDVPPFITPPGADARETQEQGFADLWRALPATVRHVVPIRDVTWSPRPTVDCVEDALARGHPPACPRPRREVLVYDPAVGAMERLRGRRYRLVDLTRFMCGRRRCFSVVGGALVHKDTNHLTREFAATLGPYLLREVRDLLPPRAGAAGAAGRSCDPPRYPGTGYFTSLHVIRTTCRDGRGLMLAHHACRTAGGERGRCPRVRRHRCREKRVSSPIAYDARVTCVRGARRVVFNYQQFL